MFETKFCSIRYVREHHAVLCEWKQFCQGNDYRIPLEYGLKLLSDTKATQWITDTTHGFESDPSDTQWLIEEFLPKTIHSSCKTIVFIIKNDSPLKHEIDAQAKALSNYFTVRQIETMDEL